MVNELERSRMPGTKSRRAYLKEANNPDTPLFPDLIIGVASILDILRLANRPSLFSLIKTFGCPVRLVDEFRPGKGGKGTVWICNRNELDVWLASRLSAEASQPEPTTYDSLRNDIVVGQAAIMTLFKIPFRYGSTENQQWGQVEAEIITHKAPIARVGGRWTTRLSMLDQWFNEQLRGAM